MGKTVTLRRGGCIETVKIEELEKKEIHTLDDIYALPDGKRAEFPIKQRVTVHHFEKEDGEEYAFGEEVPVGIFEDFSVKAGVPSEAKDY